jgi:hypothetical protein
MIKRFIQKPPMVFPWVALFHIAMLAFSIYNYADEPFPSIGWLQPLWMVGYTAAWIFCCDMKRWAALVYMGLSSVNLLLIYLERQGLVPFNYLGPFFPMDVLFTLLLMYYFRQMD